MTDEAKSQKQLAEGLNEVKGLPDVSNGSIHSFQENPENNLHWKTTFLHSLLLSVPDFIFYKDTKGVYLECNPAFSEFTGQAIDEIIGKTDYDLFEKEVADYFRMNDCKTMKDGRPRKNGEWVIYPDGRHVFLETLKTPLKALDGKLMGILGISRDVTDRKSTGDILPDFQGELFQIVNSSLCPIFVIGKDHTVIYWNKACESMFGIAAAEMVGAKEPWKAFYPRKRPLLADLIVDGQNQLIKSYYDNKNLKSSSIEGGYEAQDYFPQIDKWILFNAAPLRNMEGRIVGAIETLQDITVSKKAEERLAKQHEQLISILEAIDEPVYVCDPKDYELLFANFPLKDEHGIDIIGKKCYSVLQNRDSPCPFCTNDKIFGENIGKPYLWEFQNNVNKRWYRCIDKAISWPDGRMVRFEMAIDLDEYKFAQKALQESEERFEAISTFAQDAIIAIDSEGHINFWNKAAERIFGYSSEEALAKNVHLLLAPHDYQEKYHPAFLRFQDTGKGSAVGKTLELRAKKKDGTELSVELSLSAVILNNKWTAIAVIRDITERKIVEDALLKATKAAENANRTKNEFLANMSHELRTPLNAIIGFSDVLLEGYFGELNNKQHRYLDNISNSGRHLLGIINDILDISKVESGKSILELEVISIHGMLEEMISFMQPLAADKEIVLKLEIAPGPDNLLADKAKVKQVLYNLIGNAIKFTDIGEYITINTKTEGNMAYISVIDTGIGIGAHDKERLFRPFTQLDSSTHRKYEGTGLGLALSKELIELHGGIIWVKSEPGKGSTFTFTLPLDRGLCHDSG
jgi:PAS domain S-box-containing protein